MKKNDIILIITILVITFAGVLFMGIQQRKNTNDNAMVVISIDGEEYGRYPLNQEHTEKIELPDGSFNTLQISDGYADMIEADCRDQICVNHFHIHYSGETIVCLPNKVVVEIVGGEEDDIDGATH
jgi:hypothetical protein